MKKSIIYLGTAIIFACTLGCSENEATDDSNSSDVLYGQVLNDVPVSVITATYKSLYDNAVLLKTAVNNLSIGDETELTAVKNAWIATRSPWEKSEGFLYGPVDTEGIDPAIDSWPVNVTDIEAILKSANPITSSLLETNNEARGFHTLEYFVWGLNGNKKASELTARQLQFLVAVAENLQDKTAQLYNGWIVGKGNFVSNFTNAGKSTSIYTSKKSALEEIAEGLVIIADEVANGKIEDPLNGNNGGANPEAEESRFSNNSKVDFADNMRSIQNIYLGNNNGFDGKGLTDIVASKNANLDTNIKNKITAAILAIESIPGTFTTAIVSNRAAVQNAQTKVAELKTVLESELQPFISKL